MLSRRRQLKKEKNKGRKKFMFVLLIFLIIGIFIIEFFYLNFSFGRSVYISPLAHDKVSKTLTIQQELEKAKVNYKSVNERPDSSIEVTLKEGGVVILSSKKDIGSQLSSLQLILSRLTIEGKRLKTLDFRFDNPVVSF